VKRLRVATDAAQADDEVLYAPLVLLDCGVCNGYTPFAQHSATQVECKECHTVQENEALVDLNEERL